MKGGQIDPPPQVKTTLKNPSLVRVKNFAIFTGKHLCRCLFFNKITSLPATLSKKGTLEQVFPVNFAKFLRTPIL